MLTDPSSPKRVRKSCHTAGYLPHPNLYVRHKCNELAKGNWIWGF